MNTLFNKVLGENEICVFYFDLKTEGTFWPTQYIQMATLEGNQKPDLMKYPTEDRCYITRAQFLTISVLTGS